jgi:hypothetical protein
MKVLVDVFLGLSSICLIFCHQVPFILPEQHNTKRSITSIANIIEESSKIYKKLNESSQEI